MKIVFLLLLMASDVYAAVTYPTAPTAVDIRVATAKRTINITNSTELSQWFAATDTLCSGSSCGGPTYGDLVYLSPGVTFTASNRQLAKPLGVQTTGATDDYITVMTNPSGSTCPSAGTRATESNTANLATITSSDSSAAIGVSEDNVKYWRFVCLKLKGFNVKDYAYIVTIRAVTDYTTVVNGNYPQNIVFERVIVTADYDFGSQHAMAIDGSHIKIVDSSFVNTFNTGNGDSQAIYIPCGRGPIHIVNNDIASNGEPFFIGGGPLNQCAKVTTGVEYEGPRDVTLEYNWIHKLLTWKSDDATYVPQCDTAGSGTLGSPSGSNLTITAHGRSVGQYVRDTTTSEVRKITAVPDANTVTLTSAFTTSPTGHSWRYNSGNISGKNGGEFKHVQRARVRYNLFGPQWTYGTNGYDLTITPREYGFGEDIEVAYNVFYHTGGGPSLTVSDPGGGASFGPSAYATKRVWVHHNAWYDPANDDMTSLAVAADASTRYHIGGINMGQDKYGYLYSQSGTLKAGATTGNGITFTATGSPFTTDMLELDIIHSSGGRGTIKTRPTANTITVDISSAFPAGATTPNTPSVITWAIGPTATVGTAYYTCDSWVFEHNGWYGLTPHHDGHLFYSNTGTQNLCTNFIWRDNIAYNGYSPSTGTSTRGGITSDLSGGTGTTGLDKFADSGRVVERNVFYGPDTLTGTNVRQYYTGNEAGGAGPTDFTGATKNAFHEPDSDGGNGGSTAIGFTDHAAGNFRLTGTYATAAHDGTMIGPDIDIAYRRASFAYQGTPYNSATGATAVSGSSAARASAGSSGAMAGGGCVRGIIAAMDSEC